MMPTSINVGSAVLLLVGNGQVQRRANAWTVAREYGIDRSVVHSRSVTFRASLGSSVGRDLIRLEATDMMLQKRRSDNR